MVDSSDAKVYVYDADGNYQSDRDFDLTSRNKHDRDIAWDGAYFYVVDVNDAKVYVYDADGNYQSDRDFDLTSGNKHALGIAWDGAYFYVVDYADAKVYVYDADGNYQSDRDFDLTSGNKHAYGIAWDGAYLYMVDSAKVVDGNQRGLERRRGPCQTSEMVRLGPNRGLPLECKHQGTAPVHGLEAQIQKLDLFGVPLEIASQSRRRNQNGVEYFLGMWVVRKKGLLKAHDVEANNFECTYFYTQIHLFSH